MSWHQRTVSCSSSSRGTTALTRPQSRACSAPYWRQRNQISLARFWPIWRARTEAPKPPSKEPTRGPVCPKVALSAAMREVAQHVEDVAPADRVAGHHGHHRLRQPADLDVQVGDQEAAHAALPDGVVADVAGVAPGPLVAAAAEGQRPLAGQDHHPDVGVLPGQGEGVDQLLDGVGPEGVAHLGPVDGDLGDQATAVTVGEGGGGLVADVGPLPCRLPGQGGRDGAVGVGRSGHRASLAHHDERVHARGVHPLVGGSTVGPASGAGRVSCGWS